MLEELSRRLEDDEEAAKLPAAALIAMAQKYVSYLDKKAQLEAEKTKGAEEKSVLEMIDQPGLDHEKKLDILAEYQESLMGQLQHTVVKMAEVHSGSRA